MLIVYQLVNDLASILVMNNGKLKKKGDEGMQKRARIKGITGAPLIFTRLRGWLDGRKGAVILSDDDWRGHYLEERKACYAAYIHSLYTGLEVDAAPLYKESAQLVVEYHDIQDKLAKPDEVPTGSTASMLARSAGRITAARGSLETRRLEIELRLAVIDETLTNVVNRVSEKHAEAMALTRIRMEAYLHGAALSTRTTQIRTKVDIPRVPAEEGFHDRHSFGDKLRRSVLGNIWKKEEVPT